MKKSFFASILAALGLLTGCSQQPTATTFRVPEPHDVVMYQVNPRVFAPEKSLQAVIHRLDSIQALGTNVVWVMPIYPIGIEKGKNSPYCIRDYKDVAPEFGTVDDVKKLSEECHRRGMALILDWVANHTAWDNAWVKEHPDWYTQDADGNIVSPQDPGWDWPDVADLNYDNQDMRRAMIDAMKWWVTEVGLDGFRCDVADGVPVDFWSDCLKELRAAAGDRNLLMLAEGNKKENLTEGGFDMDYGWVFKEQAVKVFRGEAVASSLFTTDSLEYAGLPETKVKLRFTTNHDQSTQATPPVEFGSLRGSMAAFVGTVLLHGGPLVYSSQEVAYPNRINFFRYVPVDWGANPDIFNEYRQILSIYKSQPALRYGTVEPLPDDRILAFVRSHDGERILVAVNVTDGAADIALPSTLAGSKAADIIGNTDITLPASLSLQPYQYCIYKL